MAGITTIALANRYLREHFIPDFNAEFARAPATSHGVGSHAEPPTIE